MEQQSGFKAVAFLWKRRLSFPKRSENARNSNSRFSQRGKTHDFHRDATVSARTLPQHPKPQNMPHQMRCSRLCKQYGAADGPELRLAASHVAAKEPRNAFLEYVAHGAHQ
jgi:hypothetical protein